MTLNADVSILFEESIEYEFKVVRVSYIEYI